MFLVSHVPHSFPVYRIGNCIVYIVPEAFFISEDIPINAGYFNGICT
jgi:hypothetical protein